MNDKLPAQKSGSGFKSFFSGNILFGAVLFVSVCLFLLGCCTTSFSDSRVFVFPVAIIAVGLIFLGKVLSGVKKSRFVFAASVCISCGLFFLLIGMDFVPYDVAELWPLPIIFCGLSLFLAGFVRCRSIRPGFAVPAAVLTGLGILYLLFSLRIIKERFQDFAARFFPVLFAVAAVFLAGAYLYGKIHGRKSSKKDSGVKDTGE